MALTFKSLDSEWSTRPAVTWVGLARSVEGLNGKRLLTFQAENCLRTQPVTLSWVSGLSARPSDFGLAGFHHPMREFLKIIHSPVCVCVCTCVCVSVCACARASH